MQLTKSCHNQAHCFVCLILYVPVNNFSVMSGRVFLNQAHCAHIDKNIYKFHIIWALMQENLSLGFPNNKGADQPAHRRRMISTFVIPILESIISKLAMGEISLF